MYLIWNITAKHYKNLTKDIFGVKKFMFVLFEQIYIGQKIHFVAGLLQPFFLFLNMENQLIKLIDE